MILYVPCASVRHWVQNPDNYYRWSTHLRWEAAQHVREYLPADWPYNARWLVPKGLRNFRYFSPHRLQFVPVYGYLTPVGLFDEHEV